MCGIVGYKGKREASSLLFKGLKKLEYRGYDSAGIATIGNPSIKMAKGEGTIDEVLETELDGTAGIGHTRWATHGEVNDTNAHPHTDCTEKIAVVHNGIINNYSQLKEELEGHEFKSDTDTEVIPHLIEEELEKTDDIHEVANNVVRRLEGSYAVVVAFDTGEMIAFKDGSPLVLGEKENEVFLASDVTPFLEHTNSAIFLEDGDMVILDGEYSIFNRGEPVERESQEVSWDAEEASKQGHDHFMEKEIKEQPTTVKRAAFQDKGDMEDAVELIENAEKIYLTACGTAGIAASLGAKYLRSAGYEADVELAHEMEYRTDEIGEDDLVIAVSQSGETADLLSVLDDTEASLLAVVNVVGSTLDRISDHSLYVNAGPEIGVASTKAFTGQVSVLKLLQYSLEDRLDEGRKSLIDTADRVKEVIENNREAMEDISSYLAEQEHVYFIGRGKGFEMAREASLKLKELSYVHAEAFPGGEFKHGTLALVEDGTPVVGFLKDEGRDDMLSNIAEAKSRGADIIGTGTEKMDGFKYFIEIPEDDNPEILETVPHQMIAYLTAVKKGNNPDKPRNLAKSVTVK